MDYASVVALEVRQPSGNGEPVIRFNFKNGTDDFVTYDFLNSTGDVPLSAFIDAVAVSIGLGIRHLANVFAALCSEHDGRVVQRLPELTG